MEFSALPLLILIVLFVAVAVALAVLALKLAAQTRALGETLSRQSEAAGERHHAMLVDLHDGLAKQAERIAAALTDNSDRLRAVVGDELKQTRDTLHALRLTLSETLAQDRAAMLEKLGVVTQALTGKIDERLEQISGRVNERLEEGFKKTNETFLNVMTRLATIDEAQKKIETLSVNVVGLQELLGDKRSRGAFGEVQLEALVRNLLPAQAYEMQAALPNGTRVDCLLKLPEPTGNVAVDSKFPLENYHQMMDAAVAETQRTAARRQFKFDVKKHVEDIAKKYIIAGATSDGAVMFVPAEAVFAEIHAYHQDLIDYAMQRRVWIVSPTTLMAVLNTARAVIKDVETRRQIHIIKDELAKLGKDFARFDDRMKKLATHIRLANDDAQEVETSSRKITQRFQSIERVELEPGHGPAPLRAVDAGGES
jgi:DNA recombination protein RmuC